MKKVGMLTEEGILQEVSIYTHVQYLQHKKHRRLTQNDKLETRCTPVIIVGSVIHFRAAYITIGIFIQVSTSAQNVADVVKAAVHWQYTGEVIQERNHLNVLFVANDSQDHITLLFTVEFTVETNHTNVTCVTRHLVSLEI